MILANNNGYLELEHLSNIELYYSEPENVTDEFVTIVGDEFKHITKVMRHKIGDEIYITDGLGKIFSTVLISISKTEAKTSIKKEYKYGNKFRNVIFCIPKLKSHERFEFALEKSVELGITNFIIYNPNRGVTKGSKFNRWNKMVLSAMKQSLRSYLPTISEFISLEEIAKLEGEVIILEQNSESSVIDLKLSYGKSYYFVFGPEGGLSQDELNLVGNNRIYSLAENRLRTETAVIKVAAILPSLF